jgi:hypothetical protein
MRAMPTLAGKMRVAGLTLIAALAWAGPAAAQMDVDSLPGDQKGAKIPFQKEIVLYMQAPNCYEQEYFNLPYADVTVETVTVYLNTDEDVRPEIILQTVVGVDSVQHTIAITSGPPYVNHGTDHAKRDFTATHSVRLHHLNKPDQPLGVQVVSSGGECTTISGGVSIAGYYKPITPRH